MSRSRNRNKNNKSNNKNERYERNNYQDKFADRERRKGMDEEKYAITTGSRDNDPSWYVPNGQLLKDVASFPYGIATGRPIKKAGINTTLLTSSQINDYVLPGIMAYYITPTFGKVDSNTSALNVAANAFFTAVRHATSGTSYYEAPNLMTYMLGMASAYSYYSYLIRAYGVMTHFSMLNRYTPQALITAMGIDYEDLKDNLADFRLAVNQFAYKLASFCVPRDMNYLTRQIFLYESIYTDADNAKAQYYMYVPDGFYVYQEAQDGGKNVASLDYQQMNPVSTRGDGATLLKTSVLIEFMDTIMEPLITSEDIRYMSADILKAYGAGNLFKVAPISETYSVTPVYNREVLSQFENAYIYPAFNSITISVTENASLNKGFLEVDYQFTDPKVGDMLEFWNGRIVAQLPPDEGYISDVYAPNDILINMHDAEVSPESTMVATRLASNGAVTYTRTSGDPRLPGGGYVTPDIMGSEIVNSAQIWYYWDAKSSTGSNISLVSTFINTDWVVSQDNLNNPLIYPLSIGQKLSLLAKFDWNPKIRLIGYKLESAGGSAPGDQLTSVTASDYIYDQDNFTIISDVQLERINDIAMLGLFVVNQAGGFTPSTNLQ